MIDKVTETEAEVSPGGTEWRSAETQDGGTSAPEAPPLSETTIGCFIRLFFCTAACSMRAIWSEAPPAPAATTISTGFDGSHAMAGAAMDTASSAAQT